MNIRYQISEFEGAGCRNYRNQKQAEPDFIKDIFPEIRIEKDKAYSMLNTDLTRGLVWILSISNNLK